VRLPILIWKRGWKAIGLGRFVILSIEWLLVLTSFGLVSGLGYILDCKLRADELLPS
jgi:hypothetical protein